jgi:thiol:disulfide interchange protein DsbA
VKRRQFSSSLAAAALGLPFLESAHAQGVPVEGKDYVRMGSPVPMTTAAGQVDVIEFFSFACPHCNEFEEEIEPWVKRLPPYVHFHRVPVPFLFNVENFQPLYYTLETMGLSDKIPAVFASVHVDHQRLLSEAELKAFCAKNGIDAAKFMGVFNSFSVRTKVQQGNRIVEAAGINEVPVLMVQGRFITTPAKAGGRPAALRVADFLIQQVKSGK